MAPVIAELEIHEKTEMVADTGIFIELLRSGSALAIIFGGIFPYIPQYMTIKRSGSAEGFSLFVCFTQLFANILRIFFWFGKRFEYPLLLQSLIMVVVMMILVHAAVNSTTTKRKFADTPRHFRDMEPSAFWNWGDFRSYVECIVVLTLACGLLTYGLTAIDAAYMEIVGFMAVFIEACLGMPQFLRNCQKRSTAGMSVAMVAMWTSGDTFKTVYFYLREAPAQFFICGVLQIVVDVAILIQIVVFRRESSTNGHGLAPAGASPSWPARDKPSPKSIV